MSHDIPVCDLKNTAEISQLCQRSKEPITITQNGYDDMVIMSAKLYNRIRPYCVFEKLMEAENDIVRGRVSDAHASLQRLREKHSL